MVDTQSSEQGELLAEGEKALKIIEKHERYYYRGLILSALLAILPLLVVTEWHALIVGELTWIYAVTLTISLLFLGIAYWCQRRLRYWQEQMREYMSSLTHQAVAEAAREALLKAKPPSTPYH